MPGTSRKGAANSEKGAAWPAGRMGPGGCVSRQERCTSRSCDGREPAGKPASEGWLCQARPGARAPWAQSGPTLDGAAVAFAGSNEGARQSGRRRPVAFVQGRGSGSPDRRRGARRGRGHVTWTRGSNWCSPSGPACCCWAVPL